MEPLESAAGQKGTKVPREKNPLQRKWVSDPTTGTKRSTFADPEGKRHLQREGQGVGDASSGSIAGSAQKYGSGKRSTSSQSSQDNPYPPLYPSAYAYQLSQSFPQQSIQDRFLPGAKPQPSLEAHPWPFASHLPSLTSDDLFPAHSRGHGGVFPRRKSPSLPSSFSQYSQSGIEPPEEAHKKEQKPKKPGKYICHYCGRACAKPSVLKKHIRSHTGERPYPCVPCGFSFKTKSNLYKHRKSHAHAIKAGLLPFSELAATRTDLDQASSVGEAEVHSDGEQSTDTDEEGTEGSMYMDKSSPVPQISFESDKSTMEKGGEPAYADSAEELTVASMKVPILIVPKQGIPSTAMECPQFTDIEASSIGAQGGNRVDDSHTNKQKLVLRLTEKKGQDSEQSLNLLSPHSKGSTDSGYFSRSESAEQQISPPNTNVKSYEEIMFGRTWYYRPNPRPRQAVTVGLAAVTGQDCSIIDLNNKSGGMLDLGMSKISEGPMGHLFSKDESPMKLNPNVFFRGEGAAPQMVTGCDPKQHTATSTGLLEAPTDSGPLIRSNSMPTSSPTNLNVPQALRVSHSFDEMMNPDDVFFPGSAGLRRLRRQAAFEHSAHEGHAESDSYGNIPKNSPSGAIKPGERGPFMSESKGSGLEHSGLDMRVPYGSYGSKVGMTEPVTRKRRKEKSVGEEEDCPSQYGCDHSGSVEMLLSPADYDPKQANQETSRATSTGRGHMYSVHSQSDSFETAASVSSEDVVLVPDTERKSGGNVISVIQHTNSLSRPSSFEKSESIDHPSYQQEKPAGQYSEQSDSENVEEMQSPDSALRSESMEQQQSDSELGAVLPSQQYHMPHKLVRQPNIQVPEIRVTEEPDKSEKEPEVPVKEPEKHVEEFQWPQRSETLSQLPAEKLPPKKKRLRLAELEHSSGESSFESTCTSLSRSPSQESNLSHSSSFSMSFDREESIKSVSPTKQEDFGKQSEFLTVPGSGHSLSIPSHHQQREMRRSSSEQAPCALPTEIPEIRSKSFDYGSLSSSSRQGEVYTSASAMKERKRGYLVRQASLSVYPEAVVQDQGLEANVKQEQENVQSGPHVTGWHGTPSSSAASEAARSRRGMPPVLASHHNPLQQSFSEDTQQEGYLHSQKSFHLPGKQPSESEHHTQEPMNHEVMLYSSLHGSLAQPPFLPFQPELFWNPESSQGHKQLLNLQGHQLQKIHIRQPSLQLAHQKSHQLQLIQEQGDASADGASSHKYQYPLRTEPHHLSSKAFSTSTVLLQQVQPVFATQPAGLQPSLPGMLVPVRIQTHVPSYGSVMYTSVSQILATHGQSTSSTRIICTDNTSQTSLTVTSSKQGGGLSLSHLLSHPGGLLRYPLWKVPEPLPGRLNTGIPLSLTSGTISTTDASSNIGGSKRMLSPASSLELFIETKQQKRVKEETMYGQIVKELSAVELSNSGVSKDSGKSPKSGLSKNDGSIDYQEGMVSPPLDFPSSKAPLRSSAPYLPEVPPAESFTPPLQIVMDTPDGRESPEELDVDESTPEASSSPQSMVSSSDTQDETKPGSKMPVNMLVQLAANHGGDVASTLLLTDLADVQQLFQFPSLRTTTSVSWCFLNYTKPNFTQMTPHTSVYASWCISSYNPNPPSLNTKTTLALLRSKQRKNTETYTIAAMYQPGTGKLVSSLSWKQKFDQIKPELMQLDVNKFEKKMKGVGSRDKVKEDGEKDVSLKQAEPTRIKIFEGGYKSNEDYVYVRGRGRGKYICEECGIRCKKPSMLKKHIRTHTDVRPYVCKFCNFAFKTKGNLTKHMKSKAHMKKCLELGVSVTSVDDAEAEETDNLDESHRESGKAGVPGLMAEHQFSDADDSEGAEDEGEEVDEDDDEDDECEGDSTPKTRSRSTSPQPYGVPSLSVTAVGASSSSSDILGPSSKPPHFSYLASLPSIQITQLMGPGERAGEAQMVQYQKLLQGALGEDYKSRLDVPSSMDEDLGLSPDHSSSSLELSPSRLSSPGCDSSPLREASPTSRRYLSPRRDLSPRGRLSPRRDASPLRHISPRRDLSPRGHLCSLSLGRPVSPGKDVSGRRELSPRSRHRGLIRPVSPRRGSHHHGAPWVLGQYLQSEAVPLGQRNRGHPSVDVNQKKHSSHFHGETPGGQEAPSVPQGLFSHLPLHSQQQVRTPFPMIPIGGIQMVHSVPASVTGLAHVGRLPLQKSTSEESGSGEMPLHLIPEAGGKVAEDLARPQARSLQDGGDVADKDGKQEDIQTCTNAIASLCIASEEPAEGSPKSAGPLSHPPAGHLEKTQVTIQHVGGSEVRQPLVGALAGPPDSIAEQDDPTGSKGTVMGGHSAPYSESAKERQLGQQAQGELSVNTKRGKDLADDAMDNR
ncbi:transcription factor HIVEP2-like [Scleropages formosus]|uniref:HIVEP zinc finger 2a n=1 Tax=Scleropages formosus TaxID=113540 RepID=A0A0N8JYL0_SCLFO|nr:transcription factor HIVEP2 [Scleropages formosus]XP_018597974.1 transcription factor HIVEP2 [Scleropages formosus]XP_018597975.1 transcription factor HIVEP2 [Scleropages formosus]XP_018597976.1 transcription factor HIVEP2 [Scleropages formosus]XP_018597977.1 transcription factor HIVEP2 [Scleropages formosus]XP_018597978.1 transcription factor HIVEP2 [Scleropages formosus]XP_018597979.1 transcription factor HIVEP2 [Scleropages formosus]XP_018597980.1 transcription factor HIVEP2 [Scleropag